MFDRGYRYRHALESILVPALALVLAAAGFALFLICLGQSPLDFVDLVWRGAFGSAFSIQNTLLKASPLLLTALCVALPAQLGLVIIGGEGAVVLGGLAAAAIAPPLAGIPPLLLQVLMMIAGMSAGAVWIGFAGWLRAKRGINETISSLLLAYIAIALFNHIVEGPLRDPASLNKPSTADIGAGNMFGYLPGTDVHPGLIFGIIACIAFYILIFKTSFGFGCRVTGGSLRAAQLQGLPVTRLIIIACALGGACAGLAGMVEVAAVQGRANASLAAGYGYAGILIAFLARQNPLAIIPMAVVLGGLTASGGLIQRRMDLPDATVLVLQGMIFVAILASETFYGRFAWFQPRRAP
ncbi:ABC transporter permease [Beijerinckia sp. L45]|uniref:ABC transporter permease n=1 Tax=Beijerinckia sp. L45 TaxID=1641855 RepID=UPI001FEF42D3|nr:ABC transporter permease [Beijerinckia sp. L45]